MKLYELTAQFKDLFEVFDDICNETDNDENAQQAWFDTLDGIEGEFEEKAENLAVYIKSLTADVTELKSEEASLTARCKAKENQIQRLKKYLLDSMVSVGRKTIDRPMARISVRNNAESVKVEDEYSLTQRLISDGAVDFLRFPEPSLNKTAIKQALQSGITIDGASLERKQSVTIK